MKNCFDVHLKAVNEMTEIGESVERVNCLLSETKSYEEVCQQDIERALKTIESGQELVGSCGVYPWEIVQPKCDELQRVCEIVQERLKKRHEILMKNHELMERVEKVCY